MYRDLEIKRGDIYWVRLGEASGSIQGGVRPAIIVSNDLNNKYSPTLTIVPVSTQVHKCKLPTHVRVSIGSNGLKEESFIMAEQITITNKSSLCGKIGQLNNEDIIKLNKALEVQINLVKEQPRVLTREEQIAIRKAEYIRGIDSLIQIWLEKGRDIKMISEDIQEREIKIKDLERYCGRYNIQYKQFYTPKQLGSVCEETNNIRMVG